VPNSSQPRRVSCLISCALGVFTSLSDGQKQMNWNYDLLSHCLLVFFSNSLFARSVFGFHRSRRGVVYLSFLSTLYALRSLGDLVLKIHAYEPGRHRATCLYSKNFWDRLQKLWNSAIRCQVVKYRMFFRQNCSLTLHRRETGTIVDRKAVHSINHQTKN